MLTIKLTHYIRIKSNITWQEIKVEIAYCFVIAIFLKKFINILSGIPIKDVEMYYKFSKPGKWEKGHVQNIGKPDITFNSFNGGEDNGSDIYGTFEGVEEHKGEI